MADLTGIGSVLDFGGKLIDRLWPDPAKADLAKLELFKLQQSGELAVMQEQAGIAKAQIEVNAAEAANPSLFVSGWRPAIGWICGLACAWNWVGLSVLDTALQVSGHTANLAPADVSEMMPILAGLLGLGAFRTYERVRGVQRVG